MHCDFDELKRRTMSKVTRYTCGNGEGMFDDKEGYWIKYEEYKKVVDELNAIKNHGVSHHVSDSLLTDKDYWKIRCQLSEAIEANNPCDPDITREQIKAYEDYNKFISHYGNER